MHRTFYTFLLFLLCCSTSFTALCQPPITVDNIEISNYVGKNVSSYSDTSAKLTLKDVMATPGLFKPSLLSVLNLGKTGNNNWVKFTLKNNTANPKLIANIEYPLIHSVWLYSIHNNGQIDSSYISGLAPISSRPYPHQYYIFDISVPQDSTVTCYLKLASQGEIIVPLKIETSETVSSTISNIDLFSGLYFGIMVVMFLYNLFVYFSVKDNSYLFYVNYIFWVTITQSALQGYGARFLWPGSEWAMRNMVNITGAMSGIATILFVQSFLQTRKNLPFFHKLLYLVIIGDSLGIVFILMGNNVTSTNLIDASAGIGTLMVIITAIILYTRKLRTAGFFLIAWVAFLVSIIIFIVMKNGGMSYNFFTSHSVQVGSAVEAVLLSFALADSINILKKEKEISQAQALEAAQENARIIREQNVVLEVKVNERTTELKESNDGLNKALKELKEAETQLVESEKMASLGQLTAGIAHEINNPINFVTSNIKPLNRDVKILMEAISAIEEITLADVPVAEKQKKIQQYKEEIDYDYLKEEIDHLLQGMGEGASRTAEIVKGLRIFSRLDEDDLKKANINEGIDSTLVIANNLIGHKIKLDKNYGDIPMIECYAGKLNQVFLNIISNAVYAINKKFGESNTGGLLYIATRNDSEKVYVTISDNGTGMDENTKKKLFEPFFTTKDVGEGTGLGMSIVYNTIIKHNGAIHVNSTLGEGSEFIIELPILHRLQ